MKKINLAITLLIFHSMLMSYAQNIEQFEVPSYSPMNPELEAYKLYGDIPVGEYTGTPDISIPIYTLKQGNLEFPITLSYHASGIKVSQEATWVGLGWNLNVGGAISLEPVGVADHTQYGWGEFTWLDFQKMVNEWNVVNHVDITEIRFGKEDGLIGWGCLQVDDGTDSKTPPEIVQEGLKKGGERDVYSVMLPNGKFFKFILHPRDEKPIIVGKSTNCKISYSREKIYITDDDGTVYQYIGVDYNSSIQQDPVGFKLALITNKEGHKINFAYENLHAINIPSISERYISEESGSGPGILTRAPRRNYSSGYNNDIEGYLSKIETDTEEIIFLRGNREDRYPKEGGRLNTIVIKNKLTENEISRYVFNHDYFVGSNIGGDYLSERDGGKENTLIPIEVRQKRLKLSSVTRVNRAQEEKESYSFTYYEENPLPYKTSFAKDYWGYFNGNNGTSALSGFNRTLLPITDESCTESVFFNRIKDYPEPGANRNASEVYITSGMLKSIIYPTGGIVEFEYEPHQFGNYKILSKELANEFLYKPSVSTINNKNAEFSTFTQEFTLSHNQSVYFEALINFADYTISDMLGSGSTIISITPPTAGKKVAELKITQEDLTIWDNNKLDPNPAKSIKKTMKAELLAGKYILSSTLPNIIPDQGYSAKNSSSGIVIFNKEPANTDSLPYIGGGIRIKRITKKNFDNTILEEIKYTYEKEDNKSSGILLTPLQMVTHRNIMWTLDTSTDNALSNLHSFSFYEISSNPKGSHPAYPANAQVGYSRVIKERVSKDDDEGKVVYHFANDAYENLLSRSYSETGFLDPTKLQERLMFPPNYNGSLLKKEVLNAKNEILEIESYRYKINSIKKDMVNISALDNYIGPTSVCVGGDLKFNKHAYNGRFLLSLYPSLSYWVDLEEISTVNNYKDISVISTQSYIYNSLHQPSTITTTSSELEKPIIETFLYSNSEMRNRNILTPVTHYAKSKGNSKTTINNSYFRMIDEFVLGSTTETIGNQVTRSVKYKYDSKANPVEVTYQDAKSEVYLWGYNYNYVIAHLKNITYEKVKNKLGNNLDKLCSSISPDVQLLNSLRDLFSECEVTTWIHEPSIGILKVVDPRGIETNYEYNKSNQLELIKDHEGNVIEEYNYNYKNK